MPRNERWAELIAAFAGRHVLVIGDVILDQYLWGDVERTSPEAPVPVVRLREQTNNPGGAANVIANMVALGARPNLIGVIGDDDEGRLLRDRLRECGVDPAHLVTEPGRRTILKSRVICQNQQLLRIDRETSAPLHGRTVERLVRVARKLMQQAELVVFSDYGKGVLADPICRELLGIARELGRRVVVDPKGHDYAKYRGAAFITPNLKEAQAATGVTIDSETNLVAAARRLQRQVQGEAVVITRGAQGVAVFPRRGKPILVPAQALAVFDVTGAGDSLIAALSLALASGAEMEEAARIGNAAGSIVVGKIGTATVEPGELLGALLPGGAGHKLRTAAQLAQELQGRRAAGQRIVFTNGTFDLPHLGQFKFLQQARRLGDVLIVGLNSDASVRAIKGPPRPVLNEQERAAMLGAISAVDYVVVFEEETPERLLEQLRPDVLVKGKGLRAEEVVGREIVERHGGRIELLPMLGEITTERLVERIARGR